MSALPDDARRNPDAATQALRRAALAVARPGGPGLFDEMVRELAGALGVAVVFVAVFDDEAGTRMRTLAAWLDGRPLPNFDYLLEGSPCATVVGREFRHVGKGVCTEFRPDTIFAAEGMDSYAAHPLDDSAGKPLGLLVAMDRAPIADAGLAETLLKIFAGRIAAEIERGRADAALRAAALAVSSARSATVFAELVRFLATILRVEVAFIARHEPSEPDALRMLAMYCDGQILEDIRYAKRHTPCETVLGQQFRAYPRRLRELFPDDHDAEAQGTESYAGYPLSDLNGQPLGIVSVASRQPMGQLERVEAMLKIFAVRAAAEIERLRAEEALQRSGASYRAIFDASEDAIFLHDWDSGAVLDVNPKACEIHGCTRDELRAMPLADIGAGTPPYTAEEARRYLGLAKLGRCPPFEWLRRNKDGSLHWDEVRLKPMTIDGAPHVLAFTREITERKRAEEALRLREEQYRVIFDGSADAMALWNRDIRIVDINRAFTQMYGYARDEVVGKSFGTRISPEGAARRIEKIRSALAGHEEQLEIETVRKNGERFEIELRYLPITYRDEPHVLAVARDITERRERDQALQRSEARLRATVEAAFDCVIGMDGEGRVVEFNAAAERCFGHRRADVLGRTLAELIVPERHREAHARGLRQFHHAGHGPMVGRLVETTAMRADGSEFPVELAISVAAVPEGSIFVGHLRDITVRRRGDQALRDSEAQYRAIFNASADALVLRAADFSIVDVNATYETMSGYTRAEVLGVDRVLANPPEVGAVIRGLHERALAGEPIALHTQLVRRDGERYDLELRGVPIRHRGEPHVLYIGRDITKARRAELALRASEEQYRAIFNASADALILRDAAFRAVEVNPAYTTLSGYSRDELLASALVLMSELDDVQQRSYREEHARALAGEELRFERTARRKDGQQRRVEVRGTPVSYRGEPHVLYAVRDITERHAAELQRAELEAQLRQAQKMEAIGQLTGGIAHDFNNILTSVIGYVVLAQERSQGLGDARLARQLEQAQIAAQRARDLIAQMLTFARRQRGTRQVLALAPLLRQALRLLRATLPSSIVLDHMELDADPEEATPAVEADPVQLEQVLFNLCINARDAIQGSGRVRVRLRASAGGPWHCASCRARGDGGEWVELSVSDSGSGIPSDVQERMFDPFYTTKEVGRGSGMGLAMVHGIVHDHGGHVCVHTRPGEGSEFRVLLPPARANGAAPPAAELPTRHAPAPAALHGRVLLVDDEDMVGDFMCELLDGWGLQVVLLRDALQAQVWLADTTQPLDLLITDQTMPQLTGLELAQHAVARRPGLPVLLYTGDAGGFDADELERCGVRSVLRKPIAPDSLRSVLRRLLGEHT